ncbi:MAG: histidine kinase [Paenibacillus sp.]|nr:histidine kinase [Paenibacillus sp.]
MNNKRIAALATIVLFIASYALVRWIVDDAQPMPEAKGGVLDLREWSFQDEGNVRLNGQWELYRDRLLDSEDFRPDGNPDSLPEPELVSVPGSWAKANTDATGKATYRLRVIASGEDRIFGLKTSVIQLANRIIVNGETVGESGRPDDRAAAVAKVKPYAAFFVLKSGYNDVLIQVSNFEYSISGGVIGPIYLGPQTDIASLKDRANAYGWVMIGSFFLLGLYFLGLYSRRREDRSLLALGVIGMMLALYASMAGERLIFELFPKLPFWLYIRLQFLAILIGCSAMLLFVRLAFGEFANRTVIRAAVGFNLLLVAMVLAGVFWLRTFMLVILYISIESTMLYIAYVFILAALLRAEGAIYLAVVSWVLNMYAMLQGYANFNGFPQYSIFPFEPFLILLMLALLMSLKFANSFKRIEELSVQLLKMDKLKDDFLFRTSHEFKTPLHGLMNISASLQEDADQPLTRKQRDKLKLMTSITGRLSRLVYDILDIAKLKQGELAVHPEPLDVRSVVELQLQLFGYIRERRDVRLMNAVPERMKGVLADENRFRQIVSNLLDNALKYTQQGFIEVSARENGDMIDIAFQDTGRGISEQEKAHLFEPFATTDAQSGESFGLGLAIVKQLVELHHGRISVDSRPGEGSIFVVSLPAAEAESKPATKFTEDGRLAAASDESFETPHIANRRGTYTVLAADDNYVNLKILIDALESLDCQVIAVKNGTEAVRQIQENPKIDMVVLDLMMPGMSGYEVCQFIRKTYTLLELPVLMVTAAIEAQDKLAAFEAGANDFLPKPFDLAELKARIHGLLVMKESFGKAIHMEMAFLQSQIKPHFLFNVLHSIVALSYMDIDKSRTLTGNLADYLRGSFQFNNTQSRAPFETELALIRSYVAIEQMRFKDRIQVEYDIADEVREIAIPPLLLQPLVENAIRHGLGGRLEGGTVKIKARPVGADYRIEVADDGVGMDELRLRQLLDGEPRASSGVGLQNINRRLKFEYGRQLHITSEWNVGTTVVILIPRSPEAS